MSRPVELLLQELRELRDDCVETAALKTAALIAETVDALATAAEIIQRPPADGELLRWYSVDTMLPDDGVTVLLCQAGDPDSFAMGYREEGEWCSESINALRKPTHWSDPAGPGITPTLGQKIAAENRAECNRLTDRERADLLERGLALAKGNSTNQPDQP